MRVQKPASLDHFVGEREQLVREGKADAPAVLRLVARSNLTGACTGRSPGFSPLKMAANHRLVVSGLFPPRSIPGADRRMSTC